MWLADEYFLIAWYTAGERRQLPSTQATALGLAGALLGELVLQERLWIRGAHLHLVFGPPADNDLTQRVADELTSAPQHTDVRTWLAFLAQTAIDAVADRLIRMGLVQREQSRLLWRTRIRYVAVNPAKASWSAARLSMALVKGHPMSPADMALVMLADAAGLFDAMVVDPSHRQVARRYLTMLSATVPQPFRDLAGHVQVCVGEAVLTYRS